MSVLVTAASRHGATLEIADAIARRLRDEGLEADAQPVEEVRDLSGRDAVVLGSAVYIGRWLDPALRFVEDHADELAAVPTWLFSSGPLGHPPRPEADQAVEVEPLVRRAGARGHRLFAGKLDRSKLGFGERAVVVAVRAPEGDFRDWDEIASWASSVADALRGDGEESAAAGP